MGRPLGIYPEIKHPQWHLQHGIDVAKLLIEELASFGFARRADPVFVQCFDAAELVRLRETLGCELRLIQLVGREPTYTELLTSNGLQNVARYAQGLGSHYSQLVEQRNGGAEVAPLARRARDCGLSLHPYTFRRDDLPPYVRGLDELLELFFLKVGVGGVFCDQPDVAVRVRNSVLKVQ
jgi:glycerophosphoryl diester phosphodiesterase